MISSPTESQNILVFGNILCSSRKSIEVTPRESDLWDWGTWVQTGDLAIFRPISHRISETVQDRTKVAVRLITNRKLHMRFRWYQNQRPWMTPNWPWTAIMRTVTLHTCLSEPTTKIWMKIDQYYQQEKYSPGMLVSSMVRFMRIFAGVRWRGSVKWEWGRRKCRFLLLSLPISFEPSHRRPQLLYCTMYPHSSSSLTPNVTLNDLEWPCCVKICFVLGI